MSSSVGGPTAGEVLERHSEVGTQKTLVEVREEIEQDLKKDEEKRLQTAWVARLRKNAFVRKF